MTRFLQPFRGGLYLKPPLGFAWPQPEGRDFSLRLFDTKYMFALYIAKIWLWKTRPSFFGVDKKRTRGERGIHDEPSSYGHRSHSLLPAAHFGCYLLLRQIPTIFPIFIVFKWRSLLFPGLIKQLDSQSHALSQGRLAVTCIPTIPSLSSPWSVFDFICNEYCARSAFLSVYNSQVGETITICKINDSLIYCAFPFGGKPSISFPTSLDNGCLYIACEILKFHPNSHKTYKVYPIFSFTSLVSDQF